MWKKIIFGVLFVGLIAVLLIGAINRTNSKMRSSDDHSTEQERSQNGQGNQGSGNASNESANLMWETCQGIAIDVTESELLVQSDSGDQLLIGGKAWSYVQEQRFLIQTGDQISVTGFYENDEFKVNSIDNTVSAQSIIIRESNGRPMWAGRGRGGA
jgi:hypothetical protein